MPSVTVVARDLFDLIGKRYSYQEIEKMCMEFGVEVDEVEVEPDAKGYKDFDSLDARYKIDVAANRYDLLCVEGLANALRVYAGLQQQSPTYQLRVPAQPIVLKQTPETLAIRPFVVAAVLRNIRLTQAAYDSFIDLQDKLHFNIGRRRTLVSIGTHDLDKIQAPFTYTALPYNDIRFTALSETQERNVTELFDYYNNKDVCHLKPYLNIAEIPQAKAGIAKENYLHPVMLDARGQVLSLPPVINSEYSKISLDTTNVLIEITANDFTKANIVLNIVTALFSEHCQDKDQFSVEVVHVEQPVATPFPPGVEQQLNIVSTPETSAESKIIQYPLLVSQPIRASINFLNNGLGLQLSSTEMIALLRKMQLSAVVDATNPDILQVTPPIIRSDLLHQVDVQEDLAIAYGYNNLPQELPKMMTIGCQQPLNALSNHIRSAVANCGYIEVMTWALIQTEENFEKLNIAQNNRCVTLANSKTDFTACRMTLLPGLLKVVQANQSFKLPIQIFELGDVVFSDVASNAEGAVNQRNLGVLYGGNTSGFEDVHGVLTRVMEQLRVQFIEYTKLDTVNGVQQYHTILPANVQQWYTIRPAANTNHSFLEKRAADVFHIIAQPSTDASKPIKYVEKHVGQLGVLHPTVLENFAIGDFVPCSMLEVNIESFL